ncbi:hypothetical protein Ctob_015768 [Chrysochromulina tobinii]|uniref:Uncharacterized protein n=1 Tax=Chrysochromulina tobinii TaxID=1460289 RepID=A0A0M0K8X8_9EUKA|nr:hypothetical protein Ctob_015768 [Chrysochromulina tobinii]|eukprot:KOO35259.1 hypothetical protein Ctob_015768 [Chrysochromulina sp. CCMP291]
MIPSMSIGYNAITEKGASLLARSISSGRVCIQRLNLRGNKIGRDGAVALLEGLMVAHSPTSLLDLSDNQAMCKYSMVAVAVVCKWLTTAGSPLRSLKLGQNQLCGVNWKGWGEYTSVAVEALCEALTKPACMLKDLRIFGNCWGNKDAHKLAMAIASCNQWPSAAPLDMLDMRWNEMGSDAIEALLAAATDACTVEHMPQRLRCGATLNAHTNWGETLLHDEKYMYSGSQDQTIRKWRRSDLRCEAVLKGHEMGVGPGEDQHQCRGTLVGHKGAIWMLQYDEEIGRPPRDGTLFSSGIDKMVKVWKPPGSWGEEWHGLREAAKWVSLSVSNNHIYDEGIGKLVKESKSGSRKTVATTEHYSIKVHEVRSMLEMCHEFFGDAELMLLSELLLLNPSSISRRMPSSRA